MAGLVKSTRLLKICARRRQLPPVPDGGRLRFQGFNPGLDADSYPGTIAQLGYRIQTGAITALQTVHHVFGGVVPAFLSVMSEGNIGKTIVDITG
jgi:NADPH-dependent curcumin reductase CurA